MVGYFLIASPLDAQTPAAAGDGDGAPELTTEASRAIDKGPEQLLAAQKKDGSWGSDGQGGHAVASTSLSLMAFMGKAQFPGLGPYGEQLDRGMKWLLCDDNYNCPWRISNMSPSGSGSMRLLWKG